jgi:acetyltransferase-like isoleucine patch superfamily enzyme
LLHLFPRLKGRLYTAVLRRFLGSCGRRVTVCPPFRFANLRYLHFGDDVIVNRDCWIHAVHLGEQFPEPKLVIKSHAGIGMGATISAAREVVLGEYVMLARNVYISDHRHAFENVEVPISRQGISSIKPVSIGDGTWLGQNVCILPGVHIGRQCVIGANSVVTRDVPEFSVAAGSPASVIKRYDPNLKVWEHQAKPG